MQHFRLISLACLGLALVGCAEVVVDDDAELGSIRQAIVNGSADTRHAAVGVLHSGGASACTATLIGPRTVLTAAHCVAAETPPYKLLSPVNFYPEGFSGSRIAASAVFVHPDYAGGNRADIAVVRLGQPVVLLPARLAKAAPRLREDVELVGFGRTGENSGEFGVRREASNTIALLEPQTFRVFGTLGNTGNLCNGDSGGPSFAARGGVEYLIGVHTTKGGTCGQEGNDMRVDVFRAWIIEAAQGDLADAGADSDSDPGTSSASTGVGAGGTSSQPATLDSTGTPVASNGGLFGASCSFASHCGTGVCGEDLQTGDGFCTQLCDLQDDGCPDGSTCLPYGATAVCGPPRQLEPSEGGPSGCSVSSGGAAAAGGLFPALFLLALASLRRRAR